MAGICTPRHHIRGAYAPFPALQHFLFEARDEFGTLPSLEDAQELGILDENVYAGRAIALVQIIEAIAHRLDSGHLPASKLLI